MLLEVERAKRVLEDLEGNGGDGTDGAFFASAADMYAHIHAIPYGPGSWRAFSVRWNGPMAPDSDAPWKHDTYTVYTRDPLYVLEHMARNPEFDGKWDYVPFEKYVGPNNREFSNLFSGRFAYQKAVSSLKMFYDSPMSSLLRFISRTKYTKRILSRTTAPCCMSLGWGRTKRRYLSQPAIKNFTLCTSPRATSTTRCGAHMVKQSRR